MHNAEPDMHSELAWFSIDEIPQNTIEYIKPTLEAIEKKSRFSLVDRD